MLYCETNFSKQRFYSTHIYFSIALINIESTDLKKDYGCE